VTDAAAACIACGIACGFSTTIRWTIGGRALEAIALAYFLEIFWEVFVARKHAVLGDRNDASAPHLIRYRSFWIEVQIRFEARVHNVRLNKETVPEVEEGCFVGRRIDTLWHNASLTQASF
jgi:hypothetical protein